MNAFEEALFKGLTGLIVGGIFALILAIFDRESKKQSANSTKNPMEYEETPAKIKKSQQKVEQRTSILHELIRKPSPTSYKLIAFTLFMALLFAVAYAANVDTTQLNEGRVANFTETLIGRFVGTALLMTLPVYVVSVIILKKRSAIRLGSSAILIAGVVLFGAYTTLNDMDRDSWSAATAERRAGVSSCLEEIRNNPDSDSLVGVNDYCECTVDYLFDNYARTELESIAYNFQTSGQPTTEQKLAAENCAHLINGVN